MKSKTVLVISLVLIAVMFNACKKNTTEPSTGVLSGNFFPNGDGTHYKYNVQTTDSAGNTAQGTRTSTYSGTANYGGAVFQRQIDSLNILGVNTSFVSLFQKTDAEVDYALDTTGISNFIPDSLMQYIQIDAAFKLLEFPFKDGLTWPVFNLNFKLGSLPAINIIKITAGYMGTESITLNLTSGSVTQDAAKVHYTLVITIPDLNNPLATPKTYTYTADAWLVNNIGIVKWQGNGAIIGAFTGTSINLADTTASVTQNIVSYSVK